jgi:hypothetical protein
MNVSVPILAEIADKMPALDEVWGRAFIVGAIVALLTAVFSAIRPWAGGAIVALCLALGILAASSGGMMDELIVRELGTGYLYQERASWFVPCALAALAWMVVCKLIRRPDHGTAEGS